MVKLQALLLCDLVVRAPDGKLQLQGIFHVIHVRSLPAQHPAMWLYFPFLVERLSSNGQDTIVVLFKARQARRKNCRSSEFSLMVTALRGNSSCAGCH